MKLTGFFLPVVSFCLLATSAISAMACGPYAPLIPTPAFFGLSGPHKTMSDYEREENLLLWQSLTSERIPLAHIEDVVYRDSLAKYYDHVGYRPQKSGNLFYTYLNNREDDELTEFLATAKELEKRWRDMRSPWYYPRNREADGSIGDFDDIITRCKSYDGSRLKDRYALQVARALFASRKYADCIEYTDSAFADIPDDNLMKRMAGRYAAGCWSRLGEKRLADSIFAAAGDVWSISADNPAAYMADHNPEAPQLMEYIRSKAADTLFMRNMAPIARKLLKDGKVKNTGDWSYLLAYVDNEFNHNTSLACKEIRRAMQQPFSAGELKDLARAYKMKLDAQTGHSDELLDDLKWMEGKTDILSPDAKEWLRRCRNVIYVDWVPALWKKRDYAAAILLCAYADNLAPSRQMHYPLEFTGWHEFKPSLSIGFNKIRHSDKYWNSVDYGCLSFQMMGSLTSAQLAKAYADIMSDSPLFGFLRQKARTDSDYYYELIGTLALREEDYARAQNYLEQVSDRYLRTMNIDKGGYLSRDPFSPYQSRWETIGPLYEGDTPYELERAAMPHSHVSQPGAKLAFARRMLDYQQKKERAATPDERGLARLMYAIGRRNSFEECWALTQYWRGWTGIFEPSLQYWDDSFCTDNYNFLYDYLRTIGHKATEDIYKKEVEASLAMLTTDEAKARAHYILRNLATVVKLYGDTSTAKLVKTSCDNWTAWL